MIPLLWTKSAVVRVTLAVIALALGGGAVLATQLATSALRNQAAVAVREAAGTAQYDVVPFGSDGFSLAEVAAVRKLPGVARAVPLLRKADLAELPTGSFRQVVLVVVQGGTVALRPLTLVRGEDPSRRFQVAVSESLAPGMSLATGQTTPGKVALGQHLALTETHGIQHFTVVGIVAPFEAGAPFTQDAVYISAGAARSLFGRGLVVSDIALRLEPGTTRTQLTRELTRTLSGNFTISNSRAVTVDGPLAEVEPVLALVAALGLVMALAVITATLYTVAAEATKQIGLIRLVGAPRSLIVRSFVREAVVIVVVGALAAVGAGYVLATILFHLSNSAQALPAAGVTFSWRGAGEAFLVVLVLGLIAAAAPALRASSVAPLTAIRPPLRPKGRGWWLWALTAAVACGLGAALAFLTGGITGTVVGSVFSYAAAVLFLAPVTPFAIDAVASVVGPLLAAPAVAVSARGRSRQGRRTLAVGLIFVAVAAAVSLAGVSTAALQSGQEWVNRLFVGNYIIVSPTSQSSAIEAQVLGAARRGVGEPRIGEVAPVRFVTARVGHVAVDMAATSVSGYRRSGALQFVAGSRADALAAVAAGRGVILPLELAAELKVHVGSRLRIVTDSGSHWFSVSGLVSHTLPGPSGVETMIVAQQPAVRFFGSQASGFNLIQLRASGNGAARSIHLAGFRYGMETESVAAVRRGVAAGVDHDVGALASLALIAVVIAILAAVTTLVLETRSATRELALLRVVGLSRRAVARSVLGEALAVAVVGVAAGLVGGVAFTGPEVFAASNPELPLPFAVSAPVLLALAGTVLLALLTAAILPARQVARIDPMAALAIE